MLASYNATPHNRYQPHPAEPEQYTTCSNTGLFSPEDGHNDGTKHVETEVDTKHLIVASCWFSLSSHFAHDARSQEPKASINILPAVSRAFCATLYKDNIVK